MNRVLILFAGLILTVSMAQAKDSSISSIFGEPGQSGILKQLAAISKAEQSKKGASERVATEDVMQLKCQFAYDLHRFVAGKGRDYGSVLISNSNSDGRKQKAKSTYLPYIEQEGFANGWWAKRSKAYRESGASEKKLFLHGVISDATGLYGRYGERVYGTAAYVSWQEGALQAVLKKQ